MKWRRRIFLATTAILVVVLAGSLSDAQFGGKKGETLDEFVAKLMAFNKAKDGKLTKKELVDTRLHALFDRADVKKNGYVTRADLEALFARESLAGGGFGDKGKDFGKKDKGGFGDKKDKGFGKDGFGKDGFGKGFGKGGPPRPGDILPSFLQEALNLSDAQRKQLAELQKEVDARLDKILTEEQRQQLRSFRDKGPKGPFDKK